MTSVFVEIKGTLVNLGTISYLQKEDVFGSHSIVMFWPGDSDINQTRKEFVFNTNGERDKIYQTLVQKIHAENAYEPEHA